MYEAGSDTCAWQVAILIPTFRPPVPVEEYAAAHLRHARSMPVAELEARLSEFPLEKEIIAYCRGPYCVFADEAVVLLRAHGYHARRLEHGVADWHALGLPVEAEKEQPV